MVLWDNLSEGMILCDSEGINYFEIILVIWDYKDDGSEFVTELMVKHHDGATFTLRPSLLDAMGVNLSA